MESYILKLIEIEKYKRNAKYYYNYKLFSKKIKKILNILKCNHIIIVWVGPKTTQVYTCECTNKNYGNIGYSDHFCTRTNIKTYTINRQVTLIL